MLKSTGTVEGGDGLWLSPNAGATNESGFSALPAGSMEDANGLFDEPGAQANFWSTTEVIAIDHDQGWKLYMTYLESYISSKQSWKWAGHSVRCVKD